MTQAERNKQAAKDFFAAMNRGDTPAILEAYTEDGRLVTMGNTLISGTYTKADIKAAAGLVMGAFPQGIRFDVLGMIAEGDRVAVEAESYGRHSSGAIYNNHYHFLMLFRDGKIVEFKEYLDTEHCTDVLCGGQRRPAAEGANKG